MVIGAVMVATLLRAFVGQMFLIPSPSMEQTLAIGDRVVVEKLSSIKRGQVVVFEDPGGWLTGTTYAERGSIGRALQFVGVLPDNSTEHLIKRVIGMPGDRVMCCDSDGRVTVNAQPLTETGYLYVGSDGRQAVPSTIRFDVVVPGGRLFVMGDNRAHSRDSRCHLMDAKTGGTSGDNAFVSEDLVVGRAIAVVWPTNRAHRLAIPDTVKAVPTANEPAPGTPIIHAGPEANC